MRERVNDLPRLEFPQVNGSVSGCGEETGGEAIDVQVPDCSFVAGEGSDAFAGFGLPHGGDVIFGGCEEEVAVVVVFYDCY